MGPFSTGGLLLSGLSMFANTLQNRAQRHILYKQWDDRPEGLHVNRGLEDDERVRWVVRIISMADATQISRLLTVSAPEPATLDLRDVSVAEGELVG